MAQSSRSKPNKGKRKSTKIRKRVVKKPVEKSRGSAKKRKIKNRPRHKVVQKKKNVPKKKAISTKKRVVSRKSVKKRSIRRKQTRVKKQPLKKKTAQAKDRRRPPFKRKAPSKRKTHTFIRIKVVGIGGGGTNAVTRIKKDFSVRGVEFIAINTDVQDLESCDASRKLNIGRATTKGMGAGMNPELGQQAAEESRAEIIEALKDADMIFLTAGFGGGTGTGASPIIADVTKELGILTVAIITKPFSFEGTARTKIAEEGMTRIRDKVDTLLVIPNDRIFGIIDKNTSVVKAFEKIDDILKSAVQGVAEIITTAGLVNVDFADIQAVMSEAGMAVIGVGTASGADRATKAVNQAINSPLLDLSIDGARSVLFGIGGRHDLKMAEINDAARIITDNVDPSAKIIFGAYNDRKLKVGQIKIILIAAGFNGMMLRRESDSLSLFSDSVDNLETPGETEDSQVEAAKSGRKEVSKPSKKEKHTGVEEKLSEDIWDIPTFMRRKGKKR